MEEQSHAPGRGRKRAGPGMRDVAARAGVALKTVSRVVNREPGVSAATIDAVEAAIADLGYHRPPPKIRYTPDVATPAIGILVERITEPFQASVAEALESVAHEHGYLTFVSSTNASPLREAAILGRFEESGVKGVAMLPTPKGEAAQRKAAESMRCVFIDRPLRDAPADTVLADNVNGAREAVTHLIARGHRRIALFGTDPSLSTARDRWRGYQNALLEAGIEIDQDLVHLQPLNEEEVRRALPRLASLGSPPTAIFSTNGTYTLALVHELVDQEPFAIVGFDDFPLSETILGGVSVVSQHSAAIGHTAADLLFRRLSGDDSPPQRILVGTDLIVRGSSLISPHPLRLRP